MSTVLTTILYFVLSTLSNTKKFTSLFTKRRGLDTTDTLSKTDIKSLLNQTNYFRTQVANGSFASLPSATKKLIPLLLWDDGLAASAAFVADKCNTAPSNTNTSVFKTNKFVNAAFQLPVNSALLGENFATSSDETAPNIQTLLTMAKEWINEGKQYKYSKFPLGSSTESGHFTQIIWSKTKYIGCGFKFCESGTQVTTQPTTLLVCQYYPAGNVKGEYPYDMTEDNTICVSAEAQKTKTVAAVGETDKNIVSVDKIIGEYSLDDGMYVKNGSNIKIDWNDDTQEWNVGNIAICNETQLENSIPVDCNKYMISNEYIGTIKSISISGGKCEKKSDECVYKGVKCYLWYIIIAAIVFVLLLFNIAIGASIYMCVKRNVRIENIDDNDELDEQKSMLSKVVAVKKFGISDVDHEEMIKIKADMSIGLDADV